MRIRKFGTTVSPSHYTRMWKYSMKLRYNISAHITFWKKQNYLF